MKRTSISNAVTRRLTTITAMVALASSGMVMTSCQTHTQQGALVGGLGGAAVGGLVGGRKGALIGGAAGAAGGAVIGSQKDKRYGPRY